jgi:hypothetical protein
MIEQVQLATPDCPSMLSDGPLFVVGLWRSGTSLLYALLNQHPQVALMYEAELPTLQPVFWNGSSSDWLERWQFWNQAPQRHRLEAASLAHGPVSFHNACVSAYLQFAKGKNAMVWGEKSPNFFDRLNNLSRAFPKARFLVIWRHPAAICRSILNAASGNSYFSKSGMTLRALIGCEELKKQCDILVRKGVPFHQIAYDDLVKNPAGTLSAVCSFLDIPFDERMCSLEGSDSSAIYEGEHHGGVRGRKKIQVADGAETLDSQTRAKIERYVRWWNNIYEGQWPPFARPADLAGELPGRLERTIDRCKFRCYRAFDAFTRVTYCMAPLWLLRLYRSTKARDPNPSA